jgi:phosphatidylserine/phosphatidylglycerophosphate/cardiolipin synthase-like enzyme
MMKRGDMIYGGRQDPYCELVMNEDIHARVIIDLLPQVKRFVWIMTADIKDMHVRDGKRFVPFLQVLSGLVARGVAVRLFHAKEPGPRFRDDFDKQTNLIESELFERLLCPRIHTKAIVLDGKTAFVGSANLTGAGLGAKHPDRRNFEAGFLTNMPDHIEPLMAFIDGLYLGQPCGSCRRRNVCPDPIA